MSQNAAESISTNPLHNSDTVIVHLNEFYCTAICDKQSRNLAMLTYIYISRHGLVLINILYAPAKVQTQNVSQLC